MVCLGFLPVTAADQRNLEPPGTETHVTMPAYESLAAWQTRAAHLRKQVLAAAGLLPLPEKSPLHPQVFGRVERDGYTIEKVMLETLPGYYLCGNLYRPTSDGRHPGVLLIDAFQTGAAVAPRPERAQYFLTFNKSDDANRVQDILTAIAYVRQQGRTQVRLVGLGRAGIWCVFAAAVAPLPIPVRTDLAQFTGTDDDFIRAFFVPGIQRAGGLAAARRLVQLEAP